MSPDVLRYAGLTILAYFSLGVLAYFVLTITESNLRARRQLLQEVKERMARGLPMPPSLRSYDDDRVVAAIARLDAQIFAVHFRERLVISLLPSVAFLFVAAAVVVAYYYFVLTPLRQRPYEMLLKSLLPPSAIALGDGRFACVAADAPNNRVSVGSSVAFSVTVWRYTKAPDAPDCWPSGQVIKTKGDIQTCKHVDFDTTYSIAAPNFTMSKDYIRGDGTLVDDCGHTYTWVGVPKAAGDQRVVIGIAVHRKDREALYRSAILPVLVGQSQSLDSAAPLIAAVLSLCGALLTTVLNSVLGRRKASA